MERQSKNMIAAAEEMPADKYSYKPTDQQMTFAKLMEHTIHGNEMYCSGLAGTAAPEEGIDGVFYVLARFVIRPLFWLLFRNANNTQAAFRPSQGMATMLGAFDTWDLAHTQAEYVARVKQKYIQEGLILDDGGDLGREKALQSFQPQSFLGDPVNHLYPAHDGQFTKRSRHQQRRDGKHQHNQRGSDRDKFGAGNNLNKEWPE